MWLQFAKGRVTHWINSDPYIDQTHVALCGKSSRTFAIIGTEPKARSRCAECQRRLRRATLTSAPGIPLPSGK